MARLTEDQARRAAIGRAVNARMLNELSREEMTDPKAVNYVVMAAVKEIMEQRTDVLDYKVEIEDESPAMRLAREVMEDPVQEVSLNVTMTLKGKMDKIFVGTMTSPDGHQTVTVNVVDDQDVIAQDPDTPT